jgi:quinolinate synthase
MDARIAAAKATLGDRVVILGHHYQRDEVIRFADFTGDSLRLSRAAASRTTAEFIVFCGVHFMAESADILRAPHQKVILPDLAAGCSMADMAAPDQLEMCWRELGEMGVPTGPIGDGRQGVIPVTYINSSAAIKAFVGDHGGIVCTSTNAAAVMAWAWERGAKLLMLPDQHLGRNTAYRMGVPLEDMVVWDPQEVWGGLKPEEAAHARLILWKGHCSVHTRFTVQQIQAFRQKHPDGRVVAHPECTFEVVQASDESGSTDYIINAVRNSPAGSTWAVATEVHLVNRLTHEFPDKDIVTLDPFGCLCSTMFRVSPNHLLWILEGLVNGEVHNQIVVPDDQKRTARLALDRMLDIRS